MQTGEEDDRQWSLGTTQLHRSDPSWRTSVSILCKYMTLSIVSPKLIGSSGPGTVNNMMGEGWTNSLFSPSISFLLPESVRVMRLMSGKKEATTTLWIRKQDLGSAQSRRRRHKHQSGKQTGFRSNGFNNANK